MADDKATELLERAKEAFGTTTDFKKAGYIMADGSLLDFKPNGKRRGHMDLYPLYPRDQIPEDNINDFMTKTNAIRVKIAAPGVSFCYRPNEKQIEIIAQFARELFYNQEFYLDMKVNPPRTFMRRHPSVLEINSMIKEVYGDGRRRL